MTFCEFFNLAFADFANRTFLHQKNNQLFSMLKPDEGNSIGEEAKQACTFQFSLNNTLTDIQGKHTIN